LVILPSTTVREGLMLERELLLLVAVLLVEVWALVSDMVLLVAMWALSVLVLVLMCDELVFVFRDDELTKEESEIEDLKSSMSFFMRPSYSGSDS
jgi:hypothetical protein